MCAHGGYTGLAGSRRRIRIGTFMLPLLVLALPVSLALGGDGVDRLPVKDARTHEMLRERTRSDDPLERMEAALALGRISDPADRPRMEQLLKDPDPRVRVEAVSGVSGWAADLLSVHADALADDPAPSVRRAWFLAAGEVPGLADAYGEQGVQDAEACVRAAAASQASFPGAVDMIRALRDADESPLVRAAAWERLASSGDPAVRAEALDGALRHPGSELSVRALQLLSADDTIFFDAVLSRLASRRGAELLAAIEAVSRADIVSARPLLLEAMDGYDALARKAACQALAAVEDPGVVEALGARLREDPDLAVARAAAEALSVHPAPGAVSALSAASEADRPRVRQWALQSLGMRGDRAGSAAVRRRLSDPDPAVREAALTALYRIDPAAGTGDLESIRRILRSEHPEEAAAAVRLLGAIGDLVELPFLADRLTHIRATHAWQIREAALDALIELGRGEWVDRAIELAARLVVPPPPGDPEWSPDMERVRIAALRYLARFADASRGEQLQSAFEDLPPYPVRVVLAEVISDWTGEPHEAVRSFSYPPYSVGTLGSDGRPGMDPPGIRRVQAP